MKPADRLLVLGAAGFIGRQVAACCREAGWTVDAPARRELDLEMAGAAERLRARLDPPCALVMAAAIPRERGDTASLLARNLLILCALAEAVAAAPPAHLVFLSSVDVYGTVDLRLPLDERTPPNPSGFYGVGKLCGERILACACRAAGAGFTALRIPGVYGPGDASDRLIPRLLKALAAGQTLPVRGDGSQRRDLVYVGDVAAVVERCLRERVSGVFNCVTGSSRSVREIVAAAESVCGRSARIEYQPDRPDPVDLVFAPSGLQAALGGLRFASLEEGLAATVRAGGGS